MKKRLLAVFLALSMVLAFTACASDETSADGGEKTYDLKYSFEGNETMRLIQAWIKWEEKITEATDGRVKFTNYFDSTLLDANAEITQLKAGVADIGNVHKYASDGFTMFEKWKGFTMGTPVDGQIEMTKQLIEEFPELQKELELFKTLAIAFDGGSYQLLTVDKAVKKADDMKGMVIWCEADFNDFIKGLGATPVNTPWSEVYSSLQKNMYDGMLIAAETLKGNNFAEVCDYCTLINLNYLAAPGDFMCLDTWNSLPKDIQAVFDDPEIVGFIENEMAEGGRKSEKDSLEWAKKNEGTTVIELSDAEHQKFVDILNQSKKSIAAEWDEQGLPGTKLLKRMIELSAEYE